MAAIGAVLAVTGLGKLWAALGDARMLGVADPILGMPWKQLMAGVGVLEIVVATICFFGRSQQLAFALTAWLSTNFLVYRMGLWWIGWKQPCGCLGNLTQALNITPHTADILAKCLLGFLLIASYGALLSLGREATRLVLSKARKALVLPGVLAFTLALLQNVCISAGDCLHLEVTLTHTTDFSTERFPAGPKQN